MWFDNEFDRPFRRLSDRFFAMDDDFERVWHGAKMEPYFYGCVLTVGADGMPVARQLGDVHCLAASDAREPFVDEVLDKDSNTLKLITEMPGVEKKDIKVALVDRHVEISADHAKRKYRATVPLKYKVDEGSTKATYANGVLEVTLKLAVETPKGKSVVVD